MTATGVDGGEARLDQPGGDLRRDRVAHIDRDRRAREREPGPAGQRLAVGVMAGGEDQRRRGVAERQRNFGLRRGGEGGGDAGHDVEGDVGRAERRHLLAGPAEDQRIARLEPDDAVAVPRLADEERVDLVLAERRGCPCALPT